MVYCEIRLDRWIGCYDEFLGVVGTGVTAGEYVSSSAFNLVLDIDAIGVIYVCRNC